MCKILGTISTKTGYRILRYNKDVNGMGIRVATIGGGYMKSDRIIEGKINIF